MSDTHYYKLHEEMPLRNFYGNAFSLVGNAKISASFKKIIIIKKETTLYSMHLNASIYIKNSLSLLYHLLDLKGEEFMKNQNLVRHVSKTSTTAY